MSTANAACEKKNSFTPGWKQVLRSSLSLLVITAVAVLILSVVNTLTADVIAARKEAERQAVMAAVVPGANSFSELYSTDETIDSITGAYDGVQFKGYCVEVSPTGFVGTIRMMVGVNYGGSVTGVVILDHGETAGLGAKADSPEFLDQYLGKSGTVSVNESHNSISAITGATITSKAVTEGINRALTAVLNYPEQGGMPNDEGEI